MTRDHDQHPSAQQRQLEKLDVQHRMGDEAANTSTSTAPHLTSSPRSRDGFTSSSAMTSGNPIGFDRAEQAGQHSDEGDQHNDYQRCHAA